MSVQPFSETAPNKLAGRTDFFAAWQMVERATASPAAVRSRAFGLWVGLFGCIDDDGVVTEKVEDVATRFSITRASWLRYRSLLGKVGLIEQHRTSAQHRPTIIRVTPPLLSRSAPDPSD